jgi:hypothetical protein
MVFKLKNSFDGDTSLWVKDMSLVMHKVRGISYLSIRPSGRKFVLLLHFSTTGIVAVDVQLVGGKVPERGVTLIKECMEAVILLVSEWNSTSTTTSS